VPEATPAAAEPRQFIVAAWEDGQHGQRELRQVEASSHEEAIAAVAASRTPTDVGVVYEAWPRTEPDSVVRITLEPRERWRIP
jgi:hypothetical protein